VTDDAMARRKTAGLAGFTGDIDGARSAAIDPEPSVREAALRSLDRLGALSETDLDQALVDPHPRVRVAAIELAAPRHLPPLAPLLDDNDPRVVEMACWGCGEREADLQPPIATLSTLAKDHEDPLVREAAVAALGAIGAPEGLPAVLNATTDKPAIRRRAVLALAAFDGPEVDAAWERARSDRDRQVRDAVDELLGPADTDD
jgi:HEAT repeat protein